MYKGVIVAIKEYGAFVEFSGGQQGLLHISELSHEQVSRVTDVVSIGQQLTLMCIGRDVRGNVKLSLKATLQQGKPNPQKVVTEESQLPASDRLSSTFSFPGHVETLKKSSVDADSISSNNAQEVCFSGNNEVSMNAGGQQMDASSLYSTPPVLIRSAAECDAKCPTQEVKKNKQIKKLSQARPSSQDQRQEEFQKQTKIRQTDETKSSEEHARPVMIGNSCTVSVQQIRTHGLVLQMASGVRGMLRFETCERNTFEIGEELQVLCTSINNKGIPVFSLLEKD